MEENKRVAPAREPARAPECWRPLHVVGQTVTIAPECDPVGDAARGPRLR